jgi:uncharacterized protein
MECLRSDSIIKRVALETRGKKKKTKANPIKQAFYHVCSWPLWATLFKDCCQSLVINEQTFSLPSLPPAFEGYRILFLSDLHLEITPNALETLNDTPLPEHDIVILGGDFFDCYEQACEVTLRRFLRNFSRPVYAVLGNHDHSDFIALLESLGVQVLFNSHSELTRGGDRVLLTGVDDVSQFRTPLHRQCAEQGQAAFRGCKIMISHSPDFLPDAAACGYDLQLSGHTHGGQFTVLNRVVFKQTQYDFALSGRWAYEGMQGFTSTGVGSSRYPVRNIAPEIALFTLRRG